MAARKHSNYCQRHNNESGWNNSSEGGTKHINHGGGNYNNDCQSHFNECGGNNNYEGGTKHINNGGGNHT